MWAVSVDLVLYTLLQMAHVVSPRCSVRWSESEFTWWYTLPQNSQLSVGLPPGLVVTVAAAGRPPRNRVARQTAARPGPTRDATAWLPLFLSGDLSPNGTEPRLALSAHLGPTHSISIHFPSIRVQRRKNHVIIAERARAAPYYR